MDVSAAQVLNENHYSTSDITAINTEYLIDNAITYLNLRASLSNALLAGVAGAKTSAYTDSHAIIIKMIAALLIKAYLDRGPNTNVGSLSIATVLQDPQYALLSDMINKAIERLAGHDKGETRVFLKT